MEEPKNNTAEPLVSVLMPCYNVEKYVEVAMLSILEQTYRNLEIVAIDDCSTDSTLAILEQMAKKDERIKIHRNSENLKLIETLNLGVGLCQGKYIARMDADDISLPRRIEEEVKFMEQHADYDIVSVQFKTFHGNNRKKLYPYHNPTAFEDIQAFSLFKSCVCHPAVMIRKTLFTDLHLSFEQQYLHVEDYALWSKALYLTKIANLDETLLHYRVHGSQISTANEALQLANKKEVYRIHCSHWGLPDDPHSLDIYASVAYCVPCEQSVDYLKQCEAFMLMLIEINSQKAMCSHSYLKKMLSLHWLRLCANSRLGFAVRKVCHNSPLYVRDNYTVKDSVIWFVKCLFRIEYKGSFLYRLLFR